MRQINITTSWTPSDFDVTIAHAGRNPGQPSIAHTELQNLKARMLNAILQQTEEAELRHQFVLAANEAAALAWNKPFPALMFPCLFEEKVRELKLWYRRQQRVLAATQALLASETTEDSRINFFENASPHQRNAQEQAAAFRTQAVQRVPLRSCDQRLY